MRGASVPGRKTKPWCNTSIVIQYYLSPFSRSQWTGRKPKREYLKGRKNTSNLTGFGALSPQKTTPTAVIFETAYYFLSFFQGGVTWSALLIYLDVVFLKVRFAFVDRERNALIASESLNTVPNDDLMMMTLPHVEFHLFGWRGVFITRKEEVSHRWLSCPESGGVPATPRAPRLGWFLLLFCVRRPVSC